MRLEGGQRIGERYTLRERIGSGGMADVWSADDSMLGRPVALKFLHERFAEDTQFVERFRREASAAAGLQHPNVVAVYDRGEHEGRHFIAMEYVQGASLKDLIDRGLAIEEALEITRQILAGARFAHERGIIHRDLKPHNVLVDGEGRARVTDFGIARAGASEITQTGSVLGTAQYLSPEQAQGQETTAASDLYSVGVILYEALTGQVPFDGDSAIAIALKQVSEQPRPPSRVNPKVPPALDAVVLKALAKDPANRFTSANEFLRALDAAEADPAAGGPGETATHVAAGAVVPVPVAEPPPEEEGWTNRRKAIALAVVAALLAAVAVFALTRSSQATVPNVLGDTQQEAERTLQDDGFEPVPQTFESCNDPNTVAEQDPRVGERADEGSEVRIFVSLGLRVSVPDVRGLTEAKAGERLEGDQLLADRTQRFSESVPEGRVIETDPPAAQEVECKTAVTMVVSKGANLVDLPDVLGLDEAAAKSELRRAGFIPNVETEDDDAPEGTVIAQDPGPGSTLPRNTEVAITISTGAGSVVVPDVEGQPSDTAISTLQGRGVTDIKIVEQETAEAAEDDRVLDQAPAAGTRILAGERVTLFVGVLVEEEEVPPPDEETDSDGFTPTERRRDQATGGPR